MELLRSHLIQVFHSIRSLSTILENDLMSKIIVAGSQRLSSKRFMTTKEENISCMSITAMGISNTNLTCDDKEVPLDALDETRNLQNLAFFQHTRKVKTEKSSNVANICSLYRLCFSNLENGIVEVRASLIVRLMRSMRSMKRSVNGWMHFELEEARVYSRMFHSKKSRNRSDITSESI